jgi:hypothetical protein
MRPYGFCGCEEGFLLSETKVLVSVAHFPKYVSREASLQKSWGRGMASMAQLLEEIIGIPSAVCVPCL